MTVTMNEKTAHGIAVALKTICFLAVLFFVLAGILALMGRVEVTRITTPQGSFENALLLEKDHGIRSRFLFTSIGIHNNLYLVTNGAVSFFTWLGVSLMCLFTMFPTGFAFYQLMRFFGNIAEGKVFAKENAGLLKWGGVVLIAASLITPFINGLLVPWAVTLLSANHLSVAATFRLSDAFFGAILLVMAYVFSYGLYLQDEVDHTL